VICSLAIATGIAPSVLWAEHPDDLATMVDLLEEQRRRLQRRR